MKIAFYDTHDFEVPFFESENKKYNHKIEYFKASLNRQSAPSAAGYDCVCSFINDRLDENTIGTLKELGIKLIALRSAGFNHVDLKAASAAEIPVVRVPAYSPHSVAEHAAALLGTLNRKVHKAYNRVREMNFSLNGLVGNDLHGKTVGVVGTGNIGQVFCQIMLGYGCKVIAYDIKENAELKVKGVEYVALGEIYQNSDVISLHVPLNEKTHHLINAEAFEKLKPGCILINTSRGGLIDTKALIKSLKSQQLGGAALDVYEEEEELFFHDRSAQILQDDDLARLMTFPNVIITSHQAFLTEEALGKIAQVTLQNVKDFEARGGLKNQVSVDS